MVLLKKKTVEEFIDQETHKHAVDSVSWPSPNNDYDKIKYKTKFNSSHFEVNYPQVSALARVRGNSSKSKTNFSKNSTMCCDDQIKLQMVINLIF